jgi:hypothetical protein
LALKNGAKKKNKQHKILLVSRRCDYELAYRRYKSVFKWVALEAESDYYDELFDCKTNTVKKNFGLILT